ncbi:hypothetical protein BJ878DRAFT_393020, partial [Calycina marina]
YMILANRHPSKIALSELSADPTNSVSRGIRSSVNYLPKWCFCLLKSSSNPEKESVVRHCSPIFDRAAIANRRCAREGYCSAGGCYHRTPAKLGLTSPNRSWESPIKGSASPSLPVYGHQCDVPGCTCNIYVVPGRASAIFIVSNGTKHFDATDWIAQ